MLNILKTRHPATDLQGSYLMVYDPNAAVGNALSSIIAANPYVNLGRLPVLSSVDSSGYAITLRTQQGGKNAKAKEVQVFISPAVIHSLRNFSVPGILSEVDRLVSIHSVQSRQVHRSNIQDELLNMHHAVNGYMLISAVKHEVKMNSPVPISVMWEGSTPLAGMKSFINSYTKKFKYNLGSEPDNEATDGIISVMGEGAVLGIDDTLNYLLKAWSNAIDLTADTTNVPVVGENSSIAPPKSMSPNYWYHAVFDYLMAFQEHEKISACIDSVSTKLDLSSVEPYLQSQNAKFFRDAVGASLVMAYYSIAPYLRDLQLFCHALDHAYYKQRFEDSFLRISDHTQLNAALTWIKGLKLPTLCALERHQLIGSRVRVGAAEFDATPVGKHDYTKYFQDLPSYMRLSEPGGILSKIVSLYRILQNHMFSSQIISDIDNALGKDFGISSKPIILNPETANDVVVTDGHRMSQQIKSLADYTRSHVVALKNAVTPSGTVDAILYQGRFEHEMRRKMSFIGRVVRLDAVGDDKVDDLLKYGLLDTRYPWMFIPKAVLDDKFVLDYSTSPAVKFVPIARSGGPGPQDSVVRFSDIDEMARFMGYFGYSADNIMEQPFTRRFVDVDSEGDKRSAVLLFQDAIAGPSALKFLTHSLLSLIPIYSSAEFKFQDHRTGQILDELAYPRIVMFVIPDEIFKQMTVTEGYETDPLANVFAVVKVTPSAFPDVV